MAEILAVQQLSKRFGATVALRNVSFSLDGQQIIGILGPNGAGKTTLLEILEGLTRPSEGEARLFGTPLDPSHYPKHRVGVVIEKESTLDNMTVSEYADLFAAIYQVDGGKESILTRARMQGRVHVPVELLSAGESQRLMIAAASVHRPELLFLDEPTSHLDPENKREIGSWLRQMAESCTIILTTHDLREAEVVCDYIMFLVNGEVKAQGTPAALIEAVPESDRHGLGIEDAFFYFCSSRITPQGELE